VLGRRAAVAASRLRAGTAPRGELTRDLDQAARISETIDARPAHSDGSTPLPNT